MSELMTDAPATSLPLGGIPGDEPEAAQRAWRGAGLLAFALALFGWWWWQGASYGSFLGMLTYGRSGINPNPSPFENMLNSLIPESGIQPGRATGMLIALLIPILMWNCWRPLADARKRWAQAEWWLLGALLFQFVVIFIYGNAIEPSLVWWCERAAALAVACGLMWRWSTNPQRGLLACVTAGAMVMGLDLLARTAMPGTGQKIGPLLGFGAGAPFGLTNFNSGGAMPLIAVGIGWLIAVARPGTSMAGTVSALIALALCGGIGAAALIWPPQGGEMRGKILLCAAPILAGLLAFLRCGMVMGPALAVALPAALVAALGIWAEGDNAHLATWTGLVSAVAAAVVLACPKHAWQTVLAWVVAIGILGGVVYAGFWMSQGGKGWDLMALIPQYSVLMVLLSLAMAVGAVLLVVLQMRRRDGLSHPWAAMAISGLLVIGGVVGMAWISADKAKITAWLTARVQPKESILQRMFCTAQSWEAFTDSPVHALIGYGTGATVEVLQQQPSYAGAYLSVPSYLEHAHNETWQVFMDGGVVLVIVLGVGLYVTIAPLWRRRDQPMAKALIVGWVALLFQAQFESHISQPGPLLCIAILAGASWALARVAPEPDAIPAPGADPFPPPPPRVRVGAMVLGGFGAVFCVSEVINSLRELSVGGSPSALAARMENKIKWYEQPFKNPDDGKMYYRPLPPAQKAEIYETLRLRVGPLDSLLTSEAEQRLLNHQLEYAVTLLRQQLKRFPIDIHAMRLLVYPVIEGRPTILEILRRSDPEIARELTKELREAAKRARYWSLHVPNMGRTIAHRAALMELGDIIDTLDDSGKFDDAALTQKLMKRLAEIRASGEAPNPPATKAGTATSATNAMNATAAASSASASVPVPGSATMGEPR